MAKQINIQVSEERKREWAEFADQEDRSMTSLIRTSVENYIATNGGQGGSSALDESTVSKIKNIDEAVGRVESSLDEIEDDIEIIRSRSADDPELRELSSQVLSLLPESKNEATSTQHSAFGEEPDTAGGVLQQPTIPNLAREVGSEEDRTQEALLRLQGMNLVGRVEEEGKTVYYRDE